MKALKTYLKTALASFVFVLVACSVDEIQPAQDQDNVITLVTTIGPKSGLDTRSLIDTGDGTIKSAWKVGEELDMTYYSTSGKYGISSAKAIICDVDANGSATIYVDLIDPKSGSCRLDYPYCKFDPTDDNHNLFNNQIGTIEDISKYYDYSYGIGNLIIDGNDVTLPDNLVMGREVSIWKFTFKVNGEDITNSVTSLLLSIVKGEEEYTVTPSNLNAIFVAFYGISMADVTVKAVTPNGTFIRSKEGVALKAGKLYVSEGLELVAESSN